MGNGNGDGWRIPQWFVWACMTAFSLLAAGWQIREAIVKHDAHNQVVVNQILNEVSVSASLLERVAWYQCGLIKMHRGSYDLTCRQLIGRLGTPPGEEDGHP